MNRYLSTPAVFATPLGNIDRHAGIIYGVTIAQEGPAKGHGAFIDRTFLLSIVDNAAQKPAGIKARFGHPNMCSTALGSYLGRFKNYSYSGNSVKADLYLDETARNSPSGDPFSSVLDMAGKNPDMFGASIYFQSTDSHFQKEDIDGKEVNKEYFRLLDLRGTDIVDEPAATNGLFSATTFPGIATQFLDENPEIAELIFSKPANVIEFFNSYLNNSRMNLTEKVKESFASFLSACAINQTEVKARSLSGVEARSLNAVEARSLSEVEAGGSKPNDEMLNTLFDSLSVSFPESFQDVMDFTQLQKTAAISNFLTALNDDLTKSLSEIAKLTEAHELLQKDHETAIEKCDTLLADLTSANSNIAALTEQLKARPTIPLNVTDPKVSANPEKEVDTTGKDLYNALPADAKLILKSK